MGFVLRLETSHEGLEAAECAGLHAVADARAVDIAPDQAGVLQDLQVLGHGRLGERKLVHDVTTHAGLAPDEEAHDLDPSRVAHGLGQGRQFLVGAFPLDRPEILAAGITWTASGGQPDGRRSPGHSSIVIDR
jgi:hypothetical protein